MEHLTQVLQAAQKVAQQAEVFSASVRATTIQFEANELRQVQAKESSNVALRMFREGRIGFATASGRHGAETLIDMAVETSRFGSPANFQFPSSRELAEVYTFDAAVEEIAMGRMIDTGKQLIAKVREHTPDIFCDVEVRKGTRGVSLVNSQGGEGKYERSFFSLSLEGTLVRDTDMLLVGESESSCRPGAILVDGLADSVIWQLEMAKRKATVSTKPLPIVFTPTGVATCLLGPLVLGFNGKTVLEGVSPLKDKLGKKVFDKRLNLWDDATIAYRVGSYPFDDEGVPGGRLPLITDGVCTSFLYDLQTGALAGTHSTGSGRRVGGGLPSPAMSSLVLSGGDVAFETMVEDMKEGLVVEDVIGAEEGNLLGGDFGGNVLLGYKVENGEIVGRVKDTMIAGNVYQVLTELLGIGQKARWVEGIFQTPPLYCSRVSVATKGS